jgi:curved DNA-binding protein CbpA
MNDDNSSSSISNNNNNNININPYSILNIPNNASIEEIQKSYKLLSRSFHPDKQVQNREEAQQYFIKLKGAYDILIDPILKFVYDHFGYDGIIFIKRHTKLYEKLSILFKDDEGRSIHSSSIYYYDDNVQRAKILFEEAMQFYNFQTMSMKFNKPKITGSVKVNCNTTHSALLHEGIEPISLDVDGTNVSLSISQPDHHHSSQQQQQQQGGHKNVGVTLGASSSLQSKTGEGSTSGNISLEYEPVQGTEVHANVSTELNASTSKSNSQNKRQIKPKITIGSSRIMSNRTYVHTSLSAPLLSLFNFGISQKRLNDSDSNGQTVENSEKNDWLISLTTHRSLFEDKFRCTWISGISIPDTKLIYGMISISTSGKSKEEEEDDDDDSEDEDGGRHKNENQSRDDQQQNQQQRKKSTQNQVSKPTQYSLKLNIGMNHTPLQVSATKELSENQTGTVMCGFGPMGIDMRVLSTRIISKFCKLSLGVRHVAATGLSAIFQLERSGLNLSVPILVSTPMSREYAMKSIYVTLFMSLIDAVVGEHLNENDMLRKSNANGMNFDEMQIMTGKTLPVQTREDKLLEREKKRRDRAQQIQLMSRSASLKMEKEQSKEDGLVILSARYEVSGGESIDVTVALQFWVMNSCLHLPSMTKSNMLGFYDVRPEDNWQTDDSFWNRWSKIFKERMNGIKKHQDRSTVIPTLTVRYRYGKSVYEITIFDHEELSIPSISAMRLGGLYVS